MNLLRSFPGVGRSFQSRFASSFRPNFILFKGQGPNRKICVGADHDRQRIGKALKAT